MRARELCLWTLLVSKNSLAKEREDLHSELNCMVLLFENSESLPNGLNESAQYINRPHIIISSSEVFLLALKHLKDHFPLQ